MAEWIVWFLALIQTTIQWLSTMEILGVPLLWVIIAASLLCLFVRHSLGAKPPTTGWRQFVSYYLSPISTWLREPESNRRLQVQNLTCCHYTIPRYMSCPPYSKQLLDLYTKGTHAQRELLGDLLEPVRLAIPVVVHPDHIPHVGHIVHLVALLVAQEELACQLTGHAIGVHQVVERCTVYLPSFIVLERYTPKTHDLHLVHYFYPHFLIVSSTKKLVYNVYYVFLEKSRGFVYIEYRGEGKKMAEKSKQTEVITFRTSPETKQKLKAEAEKRDWTLAQLVERIVTAYTNNTHNTTSQTINITINGG